MKDYLIEIIQFILRECALPILLSVACFFIEHRVAGRDERRKAVPIIYILGLTGKEKTRLNEGKIKKCKYIIEFYYKEYPMLDDVRLADRTIAFREITYKELLERVRKHKMILIGFEKIDVAGLSLKYIMSRQGKLYEMDERVVPSLIGPDTNYCLVCRQEDAPSSLRGNYLERSVQYVIKGHDCAVRPHIKK